jgi:quercetin dioxygenase-like cupin family protein
MEGSLMRRVLYSTLFAIIATVLAGGLAMAAIVTTIQARGTLADDVKVNVPDVAKFETKGPVDFIHAQLTFQPGDATPWHYHPGPTLVTVKEGEITFTMAGDCSSRTYTAGQSFVEGDPRNVGRAKNTGTTVTTVIVTFVTPVGSAMTFPVAPANCP